MNQLKSMKTWSADDRPREKLIQKGRAQLSTAELLAVILGSGSRSESALQLSQRILKSVDQDLHQLARLDVDQLMKFRGIGEAKAVSIVSAMELGRRKLKFEGKRSPVISSSQLAFEIASPHLLDLNHEEFWIILLNRANKLIELKNVSKGGVSGTIADAKLIFQAALSKLASSMIVCHNHPSGNLKPSKADIKLTRKLIEGGKNLDIAVLDHLILGNNSYFSFADEGMI